MMNMHATLFAIPMLFLGLYMTIFSYLFYKSGYIPRALAGLGILSFVLIFIHALATIVTPEYTSMLITVPSGLFELLIGAWLLVKGIKVHGQKA